VRGIINALSAGWPKTGRISSSSDGFRGLLGDTTNGGSFFVSPSASNFVPSNPGGGPYNTVVLTFSSPIIRIGMDEISNPGNFNVTLPGGALTFSSSLTPQFVGLEDLAGFTSVTLTVTGASNNAFSIDNLRFQTSSTAVPEPSSVALLGGVVVLIFGGLRRRRRASTTTI